MTERLLPIIPKGQIDNPHTSQPFDAIRKRTTTTQLNNSLPSLIVRILIALADTGGYIKEWGKSLAPHSLRYYLGKS